MLTNTHGSKLFVGFVLNIFSKLLMSFAEISTIRVFFI